MGQKTPGLAALLALLLVLTTGCSQSVQVAPPQETAPGQVVQPDLEPRTLTGRVIGISPYGSLGLSITGKEMTQAGYALGDLLTVTVGDRTLTLPYGTDCTDVDVGEALVRSQGNELTLTGNGIRFAVAHHIAEKHVAEEDHYHWVYHEGTEMPLPVTISLQESGGYYEQWQLRHMDRSNSKQDYPDLTDEAFANFRAIETTGMGKGMLYRSSSPIDPALGRSDYADQASLRHNIRAMVNFADDRRQAASYPGFGESYYAWQNALYVGVGPDVTDPAFEEALVEMVRFLNSNDGPYLIHGAEGKDRVGTVAALLECFMGASLEEVEQDYLLSYQNYYQVDPDSPRGSLIAEANLRKTLTRLFVQEDLESADLAAAARTYLRTVGLTDRELDQLHRQLAREPIVVPVRHTIE